VRATDQEALIAALKKAELSFTPASKGGLLVDSEPLPIGRAAAAAGLVLTELRPADGAGLEQMFLQLTADDAREEVPA
jgi:ABC-2 type transport system ATP-binding protein